MKKMLGILFFVCVCVICLYADAEIVTVPNNIRIMDVTNIDHTLYIRTENGEIYAYQIDDGTLWLYESGYDSIEYSCLFSINSALYTFNKTTNQFVGISDNSKDTPINGLIISDFKKITGVREEYYPYAMQNTPLGLFWIMNKDESDEAVLCRFDLQSQELSCRSIKSLHAYCIQNDGNIWIVQRSNDGRILSHYNWDANQLEKRALLPQGANGFVMQDNNMYFCVAKEIFKLTSEDNIESIMFMPLNCDSRINSVLIEDDIIIVSFFSQLAYRSIAQAQNSMPSLIVLNDSALTPGYITFQKEHPEVEIELRQLNSDISTIEFAQQILTGTLEYDVFKISTSFYDLQVLAEKGLLVDMTEDLFLLESVLQMEPPIIEAAMFNDRLIAVPCGISGNFIKCHIENMLQAGFLAEDIPHSYEELFNFILQWSDSDIENRYKYSLFDIERGYVYPVLLHKLIEANISYYACQQKMITFDTEDFRQLLRKCREAAEAVEELDDNGYLLFSTNTNRIIDKGIIPLSLEEGKYPIVQITVEFYILNPNSTNKQLALSYIESCVRKFTSEQKLQLYPDYREPIVNPEYELFWTTWYEREAVINEQISLAEDDQLDNYRNLLEEHQRNLSQAPDQYDLSPDDIEYYKKELAPIIYIPSTTMTSLVIGDRFVFEKSFDLYLSGALSDDQFIMEMEKICHMVVSEGL